MLPPLDTGEIGYFCSLSDPDVEFDGGKIATFNFTANLSGDSFFDVFTDETLSSAAVGGVKVFVNNAGYNLPSVAERDITDIDDGRLIIDDISNFTGFIDLQGRPNDSGALLEVWSTDSGGTNLATATSASAGKYTTVYEPGQLMVVSTPPSYVVDYYLYADRALYLPTYSPYLTAQLLLSPTTALNQLLLLGGDGTDNNEIDILDASCIGYDYGTSTNTCIGGGGADSDVNGDGTVNIFDLTLMEGNFSKTYSPWTPQGP